MDPRIVQELTDETAALTGPTLALNDDDALEAALPDYAKKAPNLEDLTSEISPEMVAALRMAPGNFDDHALVSRVGGVDDVGAFDGIGAIEEPQRPATWWTKQSGGRALAEFRVPIGTGAAVATGTGDTEADALIAAANQIAQLASNPAVMALLPPQASAAIIAIKGIATLAKDGRIKELAKSADDALRKLSNIF